MKKWLFLLLLAIFIIYWMVWPIDIALSQDPSDIGFQLGFSGTLGQLCGQFPGTGGSGPQ